MFVATQKKIVVVVVFLLGVIFGIFIASDLPIIAVQSVPKKKTSLFTTQSGKDGHSKLRLSVEPAAMNSATGHSSRGAAMCTIQKWGLLYIDEWIDYHLNLGFQKIFLYDNSKGFELGEWNMNRNYSKSQLEIVHFPGEAKQMKAYADCARKIRKEESHSWIAFFDIDEFLLIKDTERYPTIMDLLDTVPGDADALSFNWELIHMNKQSSYKPKPVTFRFRWKREKAMDKHVKTIARSSRLKNGDTEYHVHHLADYLRRQDTGGNVLHGPFNERLPDGVAVLLHYYTKSLEEYKHRCKRGRADVSRANFGKSSDRSCKEDSELLAELGGVDETVFNDAAWKFLKKNVPTYQKFEEDPFYVGHLPERWHIGQFASENKAATIELI